MRRRGFLKWLGAIAAAVAIDPLLGDQSIWGTEAPPVEPAPMVQLSNAEFEAEMVRRMAEAISRDIDREIINHLLTYSPAPVLKGKLFNA